MKLKVSKRAGEKKSELTQLRFKGHIPAAVYSSGKPAERISIDGAEFDAAIRKMPKGYLPTTVFELDIDGKAKKAIVKDIQYHPTTYKVLHLDFFLLDDKVHVDVKVPVAFEGEADCVGVKLGGFVRPVKRHIKVRCLPKDLPTDFKLSIKELAIGQTKRVGDIEFASGVRPLVQEKDIVVTIAKR